MEAEILLHHMNYRWKRETQRTHSLLKSFLGADDGKPDVGADPVVMMCFMSSSNIAYVSSHILNPCAALSHC